MTTDTKHTILTTSKQLFARSGYEGFSMRTLAKESGVGLSSIYHFFRDKDVLLRHIFDETNAALGARRAELPHRDTACDMLRDRIRFQFQNIEDIVFILKYYLHFRTDFLRLESGYLPSKAYLHIQEVLSAGLESGEFSIAPSEVAREAKVITHAINGFLLEYYPEPPQDEELNGVIEYIYLFLMRSLTNKEVCME